MGTPIWSHDGIICSGESYKNVVKLAFSKGASLKDPARLFNSSLDGNARRAIDSHEGFTIDLREKSRFAAEQFTPMARPHGVLLEFAREFAWHDVCCLEFPNRSS